MVDAEVREWGMDVMGWHKLDGWIMDGCRILAKGL